MKTTRITLFCRGVVLRMAHHPQQTPTRVRPPRVHLFAGGGYQDRLAAQQAGMPMSYRGASRRMVGRGCRRGPNCH